MKSFFKKNEIILTLIPVIAVMIAIYMFSAEPATVSKETSAGITATIAKTVVSGFGVLSAEKTAEIYDIISIIVRKCAHMTEYAALGFFTFLFIRAVGKKKNINKKHLWSLLVCVLYAISDEIHQAFVPGRASRWYDILVDAAGAVIGIYVINRILRQIGGKHGKEN